ncbi:MAG TPA: hypothetical protein VKR31_10940 [Rhizomicrobium sp.]|nr:hypothetical protein [Rhizomicrobium sp.]
MTKLFIRARGEAGTKRYTYNEDSGSIYRSPVALIDPPSTRIGSASNLSDAISVAQAYHGGSGHTVETK